jgi:solute carrier family 25 citrate transporter 1
MADPLDIPKYRNAPHATYIIIKEEGVRALYKGVTLTALRQGILSYKHIKYDACFNKYF